MLKLFCIPHSGASAMVYSKWNKSPNEYIAFIAVEVAGHGMRMNEKCFVDVHDSAKDLAQRIASEVGDEDYAILGHSLGALIAYETYYELMKLGIKNPVHMFFSGRKAPNDMADETDFYRLPDEEFIKVVESYGNTTKEVFEDETLRELFLPILRADFEMGETYRYQEKTEKINCDITVMNGKQDLSVFMSDMKLWSECSSGNCYIRYYQGGHFFLFETMEEVIEMIYESLTCTGK